MLVVKGMVGLRPRAPVDLRKVELRLILCLSHKLQKVDVAVIVGVGNAIRGFGFALGLVLDAACAEAAR
jgi:hypothetical protein